MLSEAASEYLVALGKGFGVALLVSGVLAYPIYRMLLALKSRQTVSEYLPEHQKKQGTPTMGGLIVLVGLVAAILICLPIDEGGVGFVLLILSFAAIGFADDYVVPRLWKSKRGLGWLPKLGLQAVVVGVLSVVVWPISGNYLEMELPPLWVMVTGSAFPGFVLLFYANAYNFSDGLDSLAGSIAICLLAGIGLIGCLLALEPEIAVIAGALIGALVPFLVLNRHPARVFMGDVGSLPIGLVLGMLALGSFPYLSFAVPAAADGTSVTWHWSWPDWWVPMGLLLLSGVMIAELVPVALQILWVKLFKRKLFLRTPIHHAFEVMGWPETKIVRLFALTQLGLSAAAVLVVWIGTRSMTP